MRLKRARGVLVNQFAPLSRGVWTRMTDTGASCARVRLAAVAAVVMLAMAAAGCGSGGGPATSSPAASSPAASSSSTTAASPSVPAASASLPATPAGRQLGWIVAGLNAGKPVDEAVLREHFTAAILKKVPPAQLLAALTSVAQAAPFTFGGALGDSTPFALVARLDSASGSLKVSIAVGQKVGHRISGLLFQPYATVTQPASWQEADSTLRSLASQVGLYAAEVSGDRMKSVHALDGERVLAIGSAFKFYVLGALAKAIENGTATWNEQLAVREAWKSLPSGNMRKAPAGTRYPLSHYAQVMIAESDNTATDHLIHRIGRRAVEGQLVPMGNSAPSRDEPFLTTREMFTLKLSASPALLKAWVQAGTAERRRLLPRVDALPLTLASAANWTKPKDIETVEWFASARDLGAALTALRHMAARPGLAPIRSILSKNPGTAFDTSVWKYVSYKGGSEPAGVLSLNWLLERADGRVFVLTMVLNDTARVIDTAGAVAVAQGAAALLAKVP
jgi:beta-lactamase class A